MKQTGIGIIIIGLIITIVTGLSFFTKEKVVDLGAIEITRDKKHRLMWSPLAGLAVIAVGGGMALYGTLKK
jgi:hypothetical protein